MHLSVELRAELRVIERHSKMRYSKNSALLFTSSVQILR